MEKNENYGRRAGDLVSGKPQVILEINTVGAGTYVVGYAAGTSLDSIDAMLKAGETQGLTLKMDDEQHIFMPAEMVKNSVFIVKTGGA